jgi:hypothetical protein
MRRQMACNIVDNHDNDNRQQYLYESDNWRHELISDCIFANIIKLIVVTHFSLYNWWCGYNVERLLR